MNTLDLDARYAVAGYRGVAFYLLGPVMEYVTPEPVLDCEDADCEHDEAYCWTLPEPEAVESETQVRAVMVGDDTVHIVDRDDLTPLAEDAYCAVCGQIGCTHDGRDRS